MLIEAIVTVAVLAGLPAAEPGDCGADGLRYTLKHVSAAVVVAELQLRFPVDNGVGNGDPRRNNVKKKGLWVIAVALPASNEVLLTTRPGAGAAVLKLIQQFDAARAPITP